jgi:AcrR family transcriptional regulator
MVRRTRAEMEETRAALVETARKVFGERGYAETSMDDLTAQAGLTRGALYHHFGDKEGLLAAVVAQIDAEMDARLKLISDTDSNLWDGFYRRCHAYLDMALEPEIQRIVLRDAKAVLGGASPEAQQYCVQSMQHLIAQLITQGTVVNTDAHALALLIYGSLAEAAFWIANAEDSNARLTQSKHALDVLLRGLLAKN